jgi:hypothetical protein
MQARVTSPLNPFRFGALALDDAFADREREVHELKVDALNGQDVVMFAPRRFGKSSLVWKVMQELVSDGALVAYVNLMTTANSEKLAEKLAAAIYESIASPLERARDQALKPFRGLRISPTVTIDPNDGTFSFSFGIQHSHEDISATLERLLELPAELAAGGDRPVVLIFDEFQEIESIDPHLPKLLRTVFEQQPEVARVYLGSKRHMMERIFNDENEPFWRSAKKIELDVIEPRLFRPFIVGRFHGTRKEVQPELVDELLALTAGHPYATQELCYFLWDRTPFDGVATAVELNDAIAALLRSEQAHFQLRWEDASVAQKLVLQALAEEEGKPLSNGYRSRHGLPSVATVQTALRALAERELVARRADGTSYIAEPFLAEWLKSLSGDPTSV